MFSEKTIYNYIETGALSIKNIDLPRKVRYRKRKSKHDNFSYCPIVQMDSIVILLLHIKKVQLRYLSNFMENLF